MFEERPKTQKTETEKIRRGHWDRLGNCGRRNHGYPHILAEFKHSEKSRTIFLNKSRTGRNRARKKARKTKIVLDCTMSWLKLNIE